MKKFAFIALSLAAAAFGHAGEIVHDGTFARWDERTLSVGNGLFEAKFCMRGGILRTVSLVAGDVERLCLDEGNSCDELAVAEAGSGWSAAGDRELALSVSSGGKAAIVRVWPRASGPVVEQLPASPLPSRPGGKEWGSPVFSFGWNRFKSRWRQRRRLRAYIPRREREGRLDARHPRLFPVREDCRVCNLRLRNGIGCRRLS